MPCTRFPSTRLLGHLVDHAVRQTIDQSENKRVGGGDGLGIGAWGKPQQDSGGQNKGEDCKVQKHKNVHLVSKNILFWDNINGW